MPLRLNGVSQIWTRACSLLPPQHGGEDLGRWGAHDLWLLSVAVVWGFSALPSKLAVGALSPLAVLGIRLAGVSLLLGLIARYGRGESLWADRRLLRLALLGGLIMGLQNLTFFYAYRLTTAGQAAVLLSTVPLWASLLVVGCGLESLRRRNWLGLGLGLAGVALVVLTGPRAGTDYAPAPLLGNACMVLSAALFAVFMVSMKGVISRWGPLRVLSLCFGVGALCTLPWSLPALFAVAWHELTLVALGSLVYVVFASGGYAFTTWYRVVSQTSPARASLYKFLVPVVALVAAWLLLGETPAPLQLLGVVVTLAGLYLARGPAVTSCREDTLSHAACS
jgi:drug/metabolite transporter (DMT)-like permease